MRARFLNKYNKRIALHKTSSIWPDTNDWHDVVIENPNRIIGNGQYVNFWNDSCLFDISIFQRLGIPKTPQV